MKRKITECRNERKTITLWVAYGGMLCNEHARPKLERKKEEKKTAQTNMKRMRRGKFLIAFSCYIFMFFYWGRSRRLKIILVKWFRCVFFFIGSFYILFVRWHSSSSTLLTLYQIAWIIIEPKAPLTDMIRTNFNAFTMR